jgi:transposase-like protein
MLEDEYRDRLSGTVEMDETFVGGKLKNMHKSKKPKGTGFSKKAVGAMAKTIVVGMFERNERVRAQVVEDWTREVLHSLAAEHIAEGSTLVTDEWSPHRGTDFQHEVINHAVEYVNGLIHTQGIETFWSLLKRGLSGTYVSVEPFHLFRYIEEQAFRFNNRKLTDAQRFDIATRDMVGKRLTLGRVNTNSAIIEVNGDHGRAVQKDQGQPADSARECETAEHPSA